MKITPSVLVSSLSGKAGPVVAASWKGRLYARSYVIPANPQTAAQTLQRNAFKRTVKCFQPLPADIKTFLDKLGSDEALAGFSIMMRMCVAQEKTNWYHAIVPPNRYADALAGFAVAIGTVAEGDLIVTWTAGDYVVTDVADIYVRKVSETPTEFAVPWTQIDTAALTMDLQTFTIQDLVGDTDYAVAMIPYDTSEEAFGGGDCGHATTKAA